MRWRTRFLEVLRVAIDTIRRCPFIPSTGVAGLTIESRVRPPEGKATELLMGDGCAQPGILRMAGVARFRKIERHMIGIRRALELRGMACRTIRQDAILPSNKGFVTSFTFRSGVSPDEREQILMVAHLRLGGEPALHDMALGAIRAKLAQVNVGMTIRTVLPDIGEDRLSMTLPARHTPMPAAQRISSLIVIEFRNRTNGRPASGDMAILARHLQRTMRVRGGIPLRWRRRTA